MAEHGEEGSIGFIQNRPTPWLVGDIAPSLTVFAGCPLYVGGPVGDGLQVLHTNLENPMRSSFPANTKNES